MAIKTSKSQEGYYSRYKSNKTWEVNRKRRLERALKAQPNNEQIKQALKGMVYRRKTPKTQVWSSSWIKTAHLIKQVTGRFDPAIMSANQDIARSALQKPGPLTLLYKPNQDFPEKRFFSLEARCRGYGK